MAVDNAIFGLIDRSCEQICSDLNLAVSALDGAYQRVYREDPSVRGLHRFMSETQPFAESGQRLANDGFQRFERESALYRTAFNPNAPGSPETNAIALQQLRTTIESLRLLAARRFKGALVSRYSMGAPSAKSMRVLNRAGQQIQGRDMLYLITRKALIDIFNEAQIDGLRSEGFVIARVHAADPQHRLQGALLVIDGVGYDDLPHYSDVQDAWFHPRSNAVIDRIA